VKLFLIIFDAALEDVVQETLFKAGFQEYTKFPKAVSRGSSSEPHLDSHIWPGYHVVYFIKTDEEEAEKLKKELQNLKKIHKERGFKAFIVPVEDEI